MVSSLESRPIKARKRSRWLVAGLFFVAAAVAFAALAHPFLAITQRVPAEILVVEGWIPGYMMPAAAAEFKRGSYRRLLVSGLENDLASGKAQSKELESAVAVRRLIELGVPADAIELCPAPYARWRRTGKMAGGVRERVLALALKPSGINVLTAGPHARETWVAYEHVFKSEVPVGIISIPKNSYPADRWWMTREGLFWVAKDSIAWLKEVLFTRFG